MKALDVLQKRQRFLKGEVGGYGYNKDTEYRMVTDRNLTEVNEALAELQEHLKSLEAQLANTGELTCDGCIYEDHDKDNSDECCECIRHNHIRDYYTPKDTK